MHVRTYINVLTLRIRIQGPLKREAGLFDYGVHGLRIVIRNTWS